MNKLAFATTTLVFVFATQAWSAPTGGGLNSTEFSVQVQFQPTSTDPRQAISFEDTAVVNGNVEFPSLAALDIGSNPFNLFVVDVAVDVGNDFIDIDFDNASPSTFAAGFFNGYRFTFDSVVPVDILSASVDQGITTLGISDSDLLFNNNELFLNVASRSFNSSTFARINLNAVGGPTSPQAVPLPGTLALSALGFASMFITLAVGRRRYREGHQE